MLAWQFTFGTLVGDVECAAVIHPQAVCKDVGEQLVVLSIGRNDLDRPCLVHADGEHGGPEAMSSPVGHAAAGEVAIGTEASVDQSVVKRQPGAGPSQRSQSTPGSEPGESPESPSYRRFPGPRSQSWP